MTQVTKESLAAKIKALAEVKRHYGFMSIEQEYNLKAYKMLLGYVSDCEHIWLQTLESKTKQCIICDEIRELE